MRRESLEALGAVPASRESLIGLGLAEVREQLPEVIGEMARAVADNPKEMFLIASISYVTSEALLHLVRPRSPIGVAMTFTVAAALSGFACSELVSRGYLNIRVRDDHGRLVPAFGRDDDDEQAGPADPAPPGD